MYSPQTHYTCAICKRQRPNAKRHEQRMVCSDTADCMKAVGRAKLLAQRVYTSAA